MQVLYKFLKTIDSNILKIVINGIYFSISISIASTIILFVYIYCYKVPQLFYIGVSILKTSIYFITFFIIYGISFNKIMKDLL